jgi:hypothetical protein
MDSNKNEKPLQNVDSETKLSTLITWVAPIFLLLALLAVSIHFGQSHFIDCEQIKDDWNKEQCLGSTEADYRAAWGQFGDFVGGILNPIFGFLTICLLVNELRVTRKAAADAERAQKANEIILQNQLLEAQSQNRFSNYFKHLDEFSAYLKDFKGYNDVKIDDRPLHKLIFPNCLGGNYHPSNEFSKNFETLIQKVWSAFGDLNATCYATVSETVVSIDDMVKTFRAENFEVIIANQLRKRIDGRYISGLEKKLKCGENCLDLAADNIVTHLRYLFLELQCYEYALKFNINGSFTSNPYASLLAQIIECMDLAIINYSFIRGELGAVDSDGNIIYWESIIKLGRNHKQLT